MLLTSKLLAVEVFVTAGFAHRYQFLSVLQQLALGFHVLTLVPLLNNQVWGLMHVIPGLRR